MGFENLDVMSLKNGLDLTNCYLTFTPGKTNLMPNPITMSWTSDSNGNKEYFATATLYVYADKNKKDTGAEPVETRQVCIPVDSSGVFAVLFESLKKQFPHFKEDSGPVPTTPSSPDGNNTQATTAQPDSSA